MPGKGKTWTWSENAEGRKINSESMTKRLLAGEVGRSFPKKHGLSTTPEYNVWKKMRYRCNDPKNQDYKYYGDRGIKVCARWDDVSKFIEDMGPKPPKCSIERIDVDGDYEPGNCVWIPHRLQAKNRRPWKHSAEGLANIAKAQKDRGKR